MCTGAWEGTGPHRTVAVGTKASHHTHCPGPSCRQLFGTRSGWSLMKPTPPRQLSPPEQTGTCAPWKGRWEATRSAEGGHFLCYSSSLLFRFCFCFLRHSVLVSRCFPNGPSSQGGRGLPESELSSSSTSFVLEIRSPDAAQITGRLTWQ